MCHFQFWRSILSHELKLLVCVIFLSINYWIVWVLFIMALSRLDSQPSILVTYFLTWISLLLCYSIWFLLYIVRFWMKKMNALNVRNSNGKSRIWEKDWMLLMSHSRYILFHLLNFHGSFIEVFLALFLLSALWKSEVPEELANKICYVSDTIQIGRKFSSSVSSESND